MAMETDHREVRDLLEEARARDAEAFGEICRGVETRLLRGRSVHWGCRQPFHQHSSIHDTRNHIAVPGGLHPW